MAAPMVLHPHSSLVYQGLYLTVPFYYADPKFWIISDVKSSQRKYSVSWML